VVSYNMSRIRARNTRPELVLRRALYQRGFRYRIHVSLPGRPDIFFARAKVAVFVDGEFWHGRHIRRLGRELKVNRQFWLSKIRANRARDRRNEAALRRLGLMVLRIWDRDILADPDYCAEQVLVHVQRRLRRLRVGRFRRKREPGGVRR
jgi:DNA mismatch endonuclease (patch repair protein)